MSTQKQKFELFSRLQQMGFTYDEAAQLRRIEMTLQRWGEQECGDGNDYGSWAIERDEETGKPFMVHHHYRHGQGTDSTTRRPIADREAGALRRAKAIVEARNARVRAECDSPVNTDVTFYHQGDPRGCALYVLRLQDVRPGENIDSIYNRGIAVCA
jgi:hypothetical protein